MKLKTLMIINTVVALVFGIAFVLIPWQVFKIYSPGSSEILNYMGQLLGAAFIGFGLISWRARNAAQFWSSTAMSWILSTSRMTSNGSTPASGSTFNCLLSRLSCRLWERMQNSVLEGTI